MLFLNERFLCMKNISIILFLIGIFHFSGCETAPLYRGYRWYRRGNYEQSIRTFTYYLEHSSDNSGNNEEERAAAYFYRGLSKTELGRGQEAVTDYKEALSRVPDFFMLHLISGLSTFVSNATKWRCSRLEHHGIQF